MPQKKKTLHVDVTTYVLCSGKMKKPRKKIKAGINTYRIIPIMMREKDAGAFIKVLKEKIQRGEAVTRSDLAWLTLTPLMGGKVSQKERILDAYELLRDSTAFSQEEMQMMPLGRMWREDGIAEGRFAAAVGVIRKMDSGLSYENAARLLDLDIDRVREIYEFIQKHPEQTDLQIAQALLDTK